MLLQVFSAATAAGPLCPTSFTARAACMRSARPAASSISRIIRTALCGEGIMIILTLLRSQGVCSVSCHDTLHSFQQHHPWG
jgi:hypothetical protein